MRPCSAPHKRLASGAVLWLSTMLLGTPAFAEDSGPVDSGLKMMNLKADEGKPVDFVEKTRPGSTDYVPVGKQHPVRTIKPKSAADVKAMEAELDGARLKQEQAAGLKPTAPLPVKPRTKPAKAAAPVPGTQN